MRARMCVCMDNNGKQITSCHFGLLLCACIIGNILFLMYMFES